MAYLQSMVPSGVNLASCVYYRKRVEGEAAVAKAQSGQLGQAAAVAGQQAKKKMPNQNANSAQKRKPLGASASASKLTATTGVPQTAKLTTTTAATASVSNGAGVLTQVGPRLL